MRRRSPSHRNALTHLTAVIVVGGCLALGWWQLTRALSGNTLSWAYVFEWPIFAGYAVFMWWKLIHDPVPADRVRSPLGGDDAAAPCAGPGTGPAAGAEEHEEDEEDEEDEELASYNSYLAALNASGKRKHW